MEKFTGNENKAFLWSFCNEQSLFDGIHVKFKDDIKGLFERAIEHVSRQPQFNNTADKNKETIRIMVGKLNTYKFATQQQLQQQPQQPQQSQQQQNMLRNSGIYTTNDIQQERQQKFANDLQKKQQEFDSINPRKPQNIDLSDKNIDRPIGEKNLDALIAQTIAMRERDLNQIMEFQEPSTAIEVLGPGVVAAISKPSPVYTQQNVVNLKIGKETSLPDEHVIQLTDNLYDQRPLQTNTNAHKQVSFSDNDQVYTFQSNAEQNDSPFSTSNISSFFNKLKKSETNSSNSNNSNNSNITVSTIDMDTIQTTLNTLNEKLDKILKQQEIIMSKLNSS